MSGANALTRIGVLPFDWFGGGVVLADVGHQLAMEILGRGEDAAIDEVTFDFAEPKFDLATSANTRPAPASPTSRRYAAWPPRSPSPATPSSSTRTTAAPTIRLYAFSSRPLSGRVLRRRRSSWSSSRASSSSTTPHGRGGAGTLPVGRDVLVD